MGNGKWGIGYYLLVISYWLLEKQMTMPSALMPNSQCPMPNAQFPIPNTKLHGDNLNFNFSGNFGVKFDFSFISTSFANFG